MFTFDINILQVKPTFCGSNGIPGGTRLSRAPKTIETRRDLLLGTVSFSLMAGLLNVDPALAENEAITKGLSKYVKKKKLDDIDTYVPPLLRAREQMIRVGRVMCALSDPFAHDKSLLESLSE